MPKIIDMAKGDDVLIKHLSPFVHKVLIIFFHGVGDVIMFRPILTYLRNQYSNIKFDLGLSNGLDQEKIVTDAITIPGNWKLFVERSDYDLIFVSHFPMENVNNLDKTKSEICCEEEIGIPPISGHEPIKAKPLVAVHFQTTSVPGMTSPTEKNALEIWNDIERAGFIPIETHFEHTYHNPVNKKFNFVDFNVRNCVPRMEHLISLISSCYAFVGVVSGNFHIAMSVLPEDRVMLLEKQLKRQHFTKKNIATANLNYYKNEVYNWLISKEIK